MPGKGFLDLPREIRDIIYAIILPSSYTRCSLMFSHGELQGYRPLLLSSPQIRREALEYFFANSVVEHEWRIYLKAPLGNLLANAKIHHPHVELGNKDVVGGLSIGQYRLRNLNLVFRFVFRRADFPDDNGADIIWAPRGPHVGFVIAGPVPSPWHSKVAKEGQIRLEKMLKDEKLEGMTVKKLMEVHAMMAGFLYETCRTSRLEDLHGIDWTEE
ncbi:hypothetical protein MBLNU457_1707t1 [Dothideomycetes sp. NU457]